MKEHHLAVVTLEEYEPNNEFVGRNFNAGEVIQLVLRSPSPSHTSWLPLRYVQMVMVHELAHCRHMNHSRGFWGFRDALARSLAGLWARGYTGEGIWGRGAALGDGEQEGDGDDFRAESAVAVAEWEPAQLCGGTYRSRRRRTRKRKRKAAEDKGTSRGRKDRVARRFFGAVGGIGTGTGTALGADEEVKMGLEGGKKVRGRPRVAGSARGRELRAAAALARFERRGGEEAEEEEEAGGGVKTEEEREVVEVGSEDERVRVSGSESGSGSDDGDGDEDKNQVAVDIDGSKMRDRQGRALVKVCENEDEDEDEDDNKGAAARRELDELWDVFRRRPGTTTKAKSTCRTFLAGDIKTEEKGHVAEATAAAAGSIPCRLCSLENEATAVRCAACAHVLGGEAVEGSWRCAAKGSSRGDGICECGGLWRVWTVREGEGGGGGRRWKPERMNRGGGCYSVGTLCYEDDNV